MRKLTTFAEVGYFCTLVYRSSQLPQLPQLPQQLKILRKFKHHWYKRTYVPTSATSATSAWIFLKLRLLAVTSRNITKRHATVIDGAKRRQTASTAEQAVEDWEPSLSDCSPLIRALQLNCVVKIARCSIVRHGMPNTCTIFCALRTPSFLGISLPFTHCSTSFCRTFRRPVTVQCTSSACKKAAPGFPERLCCVDLLRNLNRTVQVALAFCGLASILGSFRDRSDTHCEEPTHLVLGHWHRNLGNARPGGSRCRCGTRGGRGIDFDECTVS